MIKLKLKPGIILLMIAICAVIVSYVAGAKQSEEEQEKRLLDCFFQGRTIESLVGEETTRMAELRTSLYSDWDMGPEDIISLYHQTINEKFNKYIENAIKAGALQAGKPSSTAAVNSRPPEGVTPENALKKCQENDYANYSTYCVAVVLYSDPQFGYKTFRDVMSCRKYDVFADSQKQGLYNDYVNNLVLPSQREKLNDLNQRNQAILVGDQVSAIDKAIDQAKKALDQTLSAYDQMKIAWIMHKQYMTIYDNLVKYRDKLVDIRNYVETFPAKFIDASTTKCT